MLKDITIGQYYKEDSLIHRLDPRVKLFDVTIIFDHNDQDFKGTCKIYFKRIKSNCSDLIILCNDQYVIYSRKTSDPVLDHINFCRRD